MDGSMDGGMMDTMPADGHEGHNHGTDHAGENLGDAMAAGHHGGAVSYFHFWPVNIDFLFKGWNLHSVGGFLGAIIFTFVLAIFYEYLLHKIREVDTNLIAAQLHTWRAKNKDGSVGETKESSPAKTQSGAQLAAAEQIHFTSMQQLVRSCLAMLRAAVSLTLMLAFMTLNIVLCFALLLGTGVGFVMFNRSLPAPITALTDGLDPELGERHCY